MFQYRVRWVERHGATIWVAEQLNDFNYTELFEEAISQGDTCIERVEAEFTLDGEVDDMGRTGTSYFKTLADAMRYYAPYYDDIQNTPEFLEAIADLEAIAEKMREGSIHIGPPPATKVPNFCKLYLDSDNRYWLEEVKS